MAQVVLYGGEVALIDDEDLAVLSGYRWAAHRKGHFGIYAEAYCRGSKPQRYISMHRLIMGERVDHINGNGLDNRRQNLRPATIAENSRNKRKQTKAATSRFKGVSRDKKTWRAEIELNGRRSRLGWFASEEEAADAYDRAAKRLHGEFARTNRDE